jgi:hypothetical protein
MEDIEKMFYDWAATYGDSKEEADRCKYNTSMMVDFALYVKNQLTPTK